MAKTIPFYTKLMAATASTSKDLDEIRREISERFEKLLDALADIQLPPEAEEALFALDISIADLEDIVPVPVLPESPEPPKAA